MGIPTSTRYLPHLLAAILFAFAIGTAGLAQAEPRDVSTPEYNACIDDLLGKDFSYESAIGICCPEAGGDTLRESNGKAYNCVTYDEVENSTQPPPPQGPVVPPKVTNPGLAPPPTPTKTPLIVPAPAPGLGRT